MENRKLPYSRLSLIRAFLEVLVFIFFSYTNLQAQDRDTISIDSTQIGLEERSASAEASDLVDSTDQKEAKLHLANKAALYSAIIPGLGQAYNKKYWKIPIIYGVGLLLAHQIKFNNDQYQEFRRAQLAEADGDLRTENPYADPPGDPDSKNPYNTTLDEQALDTRRERYRRDRDFMIILTALWYFINIADAHVDVHLQDFDVSEDLSFKVEPDMGTTDVNTPLAGLTFKLILK